MENRVIKTGIILDSLTPEEQQEILERIRSVPSGPELSVITAETAVPIRLTWKLMTVVATLILSVIGSVWWLANDRAEFKRQLLGLRQDLVAIASTNKDSITMTIDELDITWQLRLERTIAEVRAAQTESDMTVRETFLRLESRIPKVFPPEGWLQDVYRRDIDELRSKIEALEKASRVKAAATKTAKALGCF